MKRRTCTYSRQICQGPICAAWAGVKRGGEKDGLWVEYYKKQWQDPARIEPVAKSKARYLKGTPDGVWERFYDNGKPQSRQVFKDGLPTGTWNTFYREGEKRSERVFKGHVDAVNIRHWSAQGQRKPCPDDFRSHFVGNERQCKGTGRYRKCFQACELGRGDKSSTAAKTFFHTFPMTTANRQAMGLVTKRSNWLGPVSYWYPTGEKKAVTQYAFKNKHKNTTVLHGKQINWHPNGQLQSTPIYDMGVIVADTGWHKDGKKHYQAPYRGGKWHGVRKVWHVNGKLAFQCQFEDGLKNGPCKNWYKDGKPRWSASFGKDRKDGAEAAWYENGKQRYKRLYKAGQAVGAVTYWHENGQVALKGDIDKGTFSNFDASGEPLPGFILVAGSGHYTRYHGNGKVAIEGDYDDGYRTGQWTTHFENGNKRDTWTYTLGVLNGPSKSWHENGRLKARGHYKDDKKDGNWRECSGTVSMRIPPKYSGRGKREYYFKRWSVIYKKGIRVNKRRFHDDKISEKEALRLQALETNKGDLSK